MGFFDFKKKKTEPTLDKYTSLTTQGVEAYLKALTKINWFDYKTNDKNEIIERLENQSNNKDFIFCIYNLWFDAEGFEDDESYDNLLDEILEVIGLENSSKRVISN